MPLWYSENALGLGNLQPHFLNRSRFNDYKRRYYDSLDN